MSLLAPVLPLPRGSADVETILAVNLEMAAPHTDRSSRRGPPALHFTPRYRRGQGGGGSSLTACRRRSRADMSKPKRNAMAESLSIGHFGPDAALCRDTAEFHHRGADRPDICPNYATTTWIPPFLARVHPFSSAEIGAYGGTLKSLGNMAGTQFRTWFRPTFCRGVRDGQCSLFSAVPRRCLRGGLVLRADIKRSGRGQPSGGAPRYGAAQAPLRIIFIDFIAVFSSRPVLARRSTCRANCPCPKPNPPAKARLHRRNHFGEPAKQTGNKGGVQV